MSMEDGWLPIENAPEKEWSNTPGGASIIEIRTSRDRSLLAYSVGTSGWRALNGETFGTADDIAYRPLTYERPKWWRPLRAADGINPHYHLPMLLSAFEHDGEYHVLRRDWHEEAEPYIVGMQLARKEMVTAEPWVPRFSLTSLGYLAVAELKEHMAKSEQDRE